MKYGVQGKVEYGIDGKVCEIWSTGQGGIWSATHVVPYPIYPHLIPTSHPSQPPGPQGGVGYFGNTGGGGGGGARFGSSERCPKCGGAVYMAEKIVGAGSVSPAP